MKRPELVTATQAELDEILQRTKAVLPEHQYKVLEGVFRTFAFVMVRLQDAKASVGRLRRMLFGARTESLRNVIGAAGIEDANVVKDDEPSDGTVEQPHESADGVLDVASSAAPDIKKKRKGHGRNGADALRGATIVECCHEQLRSGQRCPQCGSGRVYDSAPGTVVRFSGQPPVAATVYRLQRLRCRLCDSVYAAEVPAGVSEASKYDASCASMLALLRYGSGMPFYRLQGLQASLHVPLPDATQWDIVKQAVDVPGLVHEGLIRQAAQAELLHNDDTPARVLALMRERRQAEAAGRATPRAINTSGIVALLGAHRVVLFFTGHAHAGQNLQDVLARRAQRPRRCRCATRWRRTWPATSPPSCATAWRTDDARWSTCWSTSPSRAAKSWRCSLACTRTTSIAAKPSCRPGSAWPITSGTAPSSCRGCARG